MKTLRFRRDDGRPVGRHPHPTDPLAAARIVAATGVDLLMVDLVGATPPVPTRPAAMALARTIREGAGVPVVLAVGLRPDTVRAAIDDVGPYGVDVITGVERAGHRKDPAKVAAFVLAARGGDVPAPGPVQDSTPQ
ncbi:hypothetical protein Rai3103_05125 [Raineyella fluvialis]|uniref:phosphoribosylanthranilate isomerase n=2 Tax=Raineyella fluvialis TaxID=2662261 RepID=A0A5Q2FE89_9ACTN|nr:hypothetical protein Rai3103_05125 [Raineyella fluvialis]